MGSTKGRPTFTLLLKLTRKKTGYNPQYSGEKTSTILFHSPIQLLVWFPQISALQFSLMITLELQSKMSHPHQQLSTSYRALKALHSCQSKEGACYFIYIPIFYTIYINRSNYIYYKYLGNLTFWLAGVFLLN